MRTVDIVADKALVDTGKERIEIHLYIVLVNSDLFPCANAVKRGENPLLNEELAIS